jgi:hypothetical protein
MNMGRIVGIVLVAVGIVLLGFAYSGTEAPADQIANTLTGRYRDQTMWYIAVGTAAVIGGGLLALFGNRG